MNPAVLLLPVALAKPPPPAGGADPSIVEGETDVQQAAVASPSQQAIVQALSVRDPAPTCADLGPLTPTPAEDLVWVVTHVTSPPWAGMKAAECLIEGHAESVRPTLQTWVTDVRLKGLGWVVLKHLDAMPRPLALELAQLAVDEGPDPAGAKRRIRRSKVAEIQAIGAE